jgi:hypothetical protein
VVRYKDIYKILPIRSHKSNKGKEKKSGIGVGDMYQGIICPKPLMEKIKEPKPCRCYNTMRKAAKIAGSELSPKERRRKQNRRHA